MTSLSHSLSLVLKKPPTADTSWLVIGDLALDFASGIEPTGRLPTASALTGVLDREPNDLVLWRPTPSDTDRLSLVRQALVDGGRLLMLIDTSELRAWRLRLHGSGFVVSAASVNTASVSKVSVNKVSASKAGSADQTDEDLSWLSVRANAFVIRRYRDGDEQDILDLFEPSFHVSRSIDHWRWKYLDNPAGRLAITIARAGDGELVAHYAGYPVRFADFTDGKSEQLIGMQIGDTMTATGFRHIGRGPTSLLSRASDHFYAAYCEGKVAFNYGFNTGNIQKFGRRFLRYESAGSVDYWQRDAASDIAPVTGYRVIDRPTLDGAFDRLFVRAAPSYGLLVQRDAEYLHWRYLQCPDASPFILLGARRWGRWVGWSVFRRRSQPDGDHLVWCDALYLPGHAEAAAAVLRRALELPEFSGVERVIGWFSPRPKWWRQQLEELGFDSLQQPDDLAVIFTRHQRSDSDRLLSNWYYTMGDSDLA